jgi:hypothetical protein
LEHPAVELTVEEFAALLSVYKLLVAEGHQFDCGTRALMACLERESRTTGDDSDGWEDDDPAGGDVCDEPHDAGVC